MDLSGKILISGLGYGGITIFCVKTSKVIRICFNHHGDVNSIELNRNCTKLFSASDDKTIGIFYIITG